MIFMAIGKRANRFSGHPITPNYQQISVRVLLSKSPAIWSGNHNVGVEEKEQSEGKCTSTAGSARHSLRGSHAQRDTWKGFPVSNAPKLLCSG